MMRVALYARVSSDRQAEEKTIDAQLYELREHCKKNDLDVFKEYIDEGISGEVFARSGLDKLRDDAEEKKFDVVLMCEKSRLSRDRAVSFIIVAELKKNSVKIICLNNLNSSDTPMDVVKNGIEDVFNEYEKLIIGERTRRGRLKKVKEEGIILGNLPPYGYDYVLRDSEKKIEGYYKVNTHEADIVKKIFNFLVYKKISVRSEE